MVESQSPTEELKMSLRKALLEYRRERPNLSLRAIAKNSGVNRYFLMKLLDDQDDSSSLDLNQVLLLSKFVTERFGGKDANDPTTLEVKKAIENAFNLGQKLDDRPPTEAAKVDLNSPNHFLVFALASVSGGCEKGMFSRVLGERGTLIAKEWLQEGILIEDSGNVRVADAHAAEISEERLRLHWPILMPFWDFKPSPQCHFRYQGLNQKGLRRVQQLHQDLKRQVASILDNPENWGSIPSMSISCSITLTNE